MDYTTGLIVEESSDEWERIASRDKKRSKIYGCRCEDVKR